MGGTFEAWIVRILSPIISQEELTVFSSHFFSTAFAGTLIALLMVLHTPWWAGMLCVPVGTTILAERGGGRPIDWISRGGGCLVGILAVLAAFWW